MATFNYTHGYDALYNIGSILGNIAGAVITFSIIGSLPAFIHNWMPEILKIAVGFFIFTCSLVYTQLILFKTIWPLWLPSYFYITDTLDTEVNIQEADKLSFLFDGSLNGRWYRLDGIKKIAKEHRRNYLFNLANHIAMEYSLMQPFLEQTKHHSWQGKSSKDYAQKDKIPYANYPDSDTLDALNLLGFSNEMPPFEKIKQAYRQKVLIFHPDKHMGELIEIRKYAEEKTKELNAAYKLLVEKNGKV